MSIPATHPDPSPVASAATVVVEAPRSSSPKGNSRGMWVVVGRIAGALFALLAHALLTRLLSPEEYGKYILILSAVTFVGGIARFGLDRTLVRYIAEGFAVGDQERVRRAISMGFWTLTGSLIACTLLVPPALLLVGYLSQQYSVAGESGALVALADPLTIAVILSGVAFASALQFVAEVFRGMHDQKNAAIFDAQASKPLANGLYLGAILAPLAVWLVQYGFDIPKDLIGAAGWMALQVALLAVLCLVGVVQLRKSLPRIKQLQPVPNNYRQLEPLTVAIFLATCVPLLFTEVVGFMANQGDVWIVGAVLSPADVAMFGAARRFVQAVSMPLMAINLIVLPSIPQMYVQRRTKDLEKLLQQNATAASLPSLVVLLLTVAFPGTLLSWMYGEGYSAAAVCLVTLSIGQVFHMVTGSCGQLLMLTGRERLVLALYVVAAIVLFSVGPFVAIEYGLTGFVIVTTSILVFEKLVLWILARWLLGIWTHASPACLGGAITQIQRILTRSPRKPVVAGEVLAVETNLDREMG